MILDEGVIVRRNRNESVRISNKVGMFHEAVTVSAKHLHQFLLFLIVLLPFVNGVE